MEYKVGTAGFYVTLNSTELAVLYSGSYARLEIEDIVVNIRISLEAKALLVDKIRNDPQTLPPGVHPCPMCKSVFIKFIDREPAWTSIRCKSCHFKVAGRRGTREDPINKWNTVIAICDGVDASREQVLAESEVHPEPIDLTLKNRPTTMSEEEFLE